MNPGLTLFTAPKPFNGEMDRIQRNAIASWAALGDPVQIILLGDEQGMVQAAHDFGVRHIAEVELTLQGTPRVDSVFALARAAAQHEVLCYVNADIIVLEDLRAAIETVRRRFQRYLVVGQRWDLEVAEQLSFDSAGAELLRERARRDGRLHRPAGSDYFVFPKHEFRTMPPFALGRAGWDNWMIFAARSGGIPVVDATDAALVIHQSHDYSHLPGGQPHYRLPESTRNTELAGGRQTIFTLADATWRIAGGVVRRQVIGRQGLLRSLEAAAYSRLGSGRIGRLSRLAFHPFETIKYFISRPEGHRDDTADARVAGSGQAANHR